MKFLMLLFLGSIVALPMVEPVMAQAGPISAAKEVGAMSATMVLALIAICSSGALIKMFFMWRKDVEDQQAKADLTHKGFINIVSENSVALSNNSTSNKEVREALYHLSSVISNCEEVRKIQK